MSTDHKYGTGSIDSPEDYGKPRAWRSEEIAGAFRPATWIEKDPARGFKTYPKRNQGAQNSCVSYALAKQLAVDEQAENGAWRELSPRSVYAYTRVPPDGGSSPIEATKLAAKQGMTLEGLLKTDGIDDQGAAKTDGYAVDARQVALVYRPASFIECSADFETVASVIESHRLAGKDKVVTISVVGENNGTWLSAFPKPAKNWALPDWRHRVTVTDYGLVGGVKHLAIDNSWGEAVGNGGQQFLSIDHEPYVYGGIYTLDIADNWQQSGTQTVPPPRHTWTRDLAYGATGPEVLVLQEALQSLGMFPVSSVVKPTGNFFGLTRKSVELFQASFILPVTGAADAVTRAKLNSIFGV